jgi:hypothetical protein
MQILHHTFTFSLHIGRSAFDIIYTCTPFHKMLLRILQNVMGDFIHTVDTSNFKEKHFLREVMITQLAKMFPTLRDSWIFIAILTSHLHDPHPDRDKCRPQCTCFYHQSSYYPQMHTCLPQVVSLVQVVEIRFWIILRCTLCWRIAFSWFYLRVNTKGKKFSLR